MNNPSTQEPDGDGAFFEKLFSKLPKDVAESFDEAQLKAISLAFGVRRWRDHAKELRLLLPLFGRNYYFVLLAGTERRSRERRLRDRVLYPLLSFGNSVVAVLFFTAILISVLITLYVLKSLLGINLLPNFSFGVMPIIKNEWKLLFG